MIIDTHCHLTLFKESEVTVLIRDANEAGVHLLLTVCTSLEDFGKIAPIALDHKSVYASVGVHPNEADGTLTSDALVECAQRNEKVVALGETGLDYYRAKGNAEQQKFDFASHLHASRLLDLPVIIHSRDADFDMSEMLISEMKNSPFKGVMHSYTSSLALCKVALDIGLFISFSGIVTFKSAHDLRKIAAYVPEDRVLVETDSPYLAPEPVRGSRNEPKYVVHVLKFLAGLRADADLEYKIERNCRAFIPKAFL